jgi:hypothetical protein
MSDRDHDVITRYAGWLPYLSADDRQWLHTRHGEVAGLCAPPGALYRRPYAIYLRWTLRAMDAEDPAAALAEAVRAERGEPADIGEALQRLDRAAGEWEDRYRPSSQIVGEPYSLQPRAPRRPTMNRKGEHDATS